jgi:hypothetical protein
MVREQLKFTMDCPQANLAGPGGNPAALDDGIYVYRTTFILGPLIPQTAVLTGLWSTDNAGVDIPINGISTGFTTSVVQFQTGFASFNITSGFVRGMNALDFVVNNGGAGFDRYSPTGLRVEISGTADRVPEPSTVALLGIGILGLVGCGWRRGRQE